MVDYSESIKNYYDNLGKKEWDRLTANPVNEVSFHVHKHYLREYLAPNSKVLEIGAGPGRYTREIAKLTNNIVVSDISIQQLKLNQTFAKKYQFSQAVIEWLQLDIADLSCFVDNSFDAVVAYGGPLSYALDKRDIALKELARVLRPEGVLFLSVMSLWGTNHKYLNGVLQIPMETNRAIIQSGDIIPDTYPARDGHFMHLFRAGEFKELLLEHHFKEVVFSASNFLSIGWNEELEALKADSEGWVQFLKMEIEACQEEQSLNAGSHIIGVVKNT